VQTGFQMSSSVCPRSSGSRLAASPPNQRMNAPVSAVTSRACARSAPAGPARYAQR
jgi:hypothetical protein